MRVITIIKAAPRGEHELDPGLSILVKSSRADALIAAGLAVEGVVSRPPTGPFLRTEVGKKWPLPS